MAHQTDFVREVYTAARDIGLSDTAARVAAAQAALETGYGKSVKGNNYFGIKAGKSWKGETQSLKTWEEVGGKRVNITDRFRSYATPQESLRDWATLMASRFPGVLTAKTFDEAVSSLKAGKKGGYATDTKYDSKLGFIDSRFTSRAISTSPQSVPVPTTRGSTMDIAGNPSGTLYDTSQSLGNVPTPSPNLGPLANYDLGGQVFRSAAAQPVQRSILGGSPQSILGDIAMPSQGPSFGFAPAVSMDDATLSDRNRSAEMTQARTTESKNPAQEYGRLAETMGAAGMQDLSGMRAFDPLQGYAVAPPAAASRQSLADQYGQLASTMGQVGMQGLSGTKAYDPLQGYAITPPAPPKAPAQVAPPSITSPSPSAPSAPPPTPAFTAQDVWSGRAKSGIATNGNVVSRNPDGTVSMTSSKYGYTDKMGPDGSYRGTTAPGLFGIDAAAAKAFSGIGGPLGLPGIQPGQGFGSRIGSGLRGAGGAIAGGMVGGMLGPIGGLLGSYIGSQMAQGKNPLGGLLGNRSGFPPVPTAPTYAGPGFFPGAPDGPGQGGLTDFGNRAARGDFGDQAGYAANNPGRGLY